MIIIKFLHQIFPLVCVCVCVCVKQINKQNYNNNKNQKINNFSLFFLCIINYISHSNGIRVVEGGYKMGGFIFPGFVVNVVEIHNS